MSSSAVKIDDRYIAQAKHLCEVYERSMTGQLNYLIKIGLLAQQNPDLPLSFLLDLLEAKGEVERGETTPFVSRHPGSKFSK
ncbi:hypothetical protein PsalN5692_03774 (plasmid) [Piscirickettsia salmonis]|uniref:TA system antitoxin ParD family protein n=1 Tax=Piscirickettsia salmonis TaxID=1238 RepID=UPI0012B71369|nr:hypothetical protein [Piscirickettsia salmonis]QGP52266.1 hypothetical protein PsalN5692_03774 [Piscirickettsia salmonis]